MFVVDVGMLCSVVIGVVVVMLIAFGVFHVVNLTADSVVRL